MTQRTPHGDIPVASFLPDATRAVVKGLDAGDLRTCGVAALMVNVLHVAMHPGADVIRQLGGIHRFMGWTGPIATDSGGFQIYSLVRQNRRNGSLSSHGFTYRPGGGQVKFLLTPEKSIAQQIRLGSDIAFCLDQCTHPSDPADVQRESVERTVAWARRCKAEFVRRVERLNPSAGRPLLYAVVQGGTDPELRRRCAEALLEIGFDGFGFGGWPIDDTGRLVEMVQFVADLLPSDVPKHALGIGRPDNIVAARHAGYTSFDSAFPTRDARHGRLLIATRPLDSLRLPEAGFYEFLYINDKKHWRDERPIDPWCACLACSSYTRAYLCHLFQIRDSLAQRLATMHNLMFCGRLMATLRQRVGDRA